LIEAEPTEAVSAEAWEQGAALVTHRNRHRPRVLSTKAGDLQLGIPKLRKEGRMNPAPLGGAMDATEFELARLCLFESYGFEASTRWVSTGDGTRTYAIVREGVGRPCVLLHGGLSQAGEWAQVAGRLSGPVVIPDRPGWGLSDRRQLTPTTFRADQSAWLLALLGGLGLDKVTLVASSIGAYVGLAFAHDHPERVQELIIVGAPAGLARTPMPMFARLMGAPVVGPLMARMKISDPEVNRKRVFVNLVAHPERIPVPVLQNDIDAMSLPGAGQEGFELMHAMSTLRGFRPEVLIASELSAIRTSTRVLWGERDSFVPAELGRALISSMPNATFEVVPDAGHCIHVELPELVAERILSVPR
jgi:pimeloyl-ACP methyl ester carboxylesterase